MQWKKGLNILALNNSITNISMPTTLSIIYLCYKNNYKYKNKLPTYIKYMQIMSRLQIDKKVQRSRKISYLFKLVINDSFAFCGYSGRSNCSCTIPGMQVHLCSSTTTEWKEVFVWKEGEKYKKSFYHHFLWCFLHCISFSNIKMHSTKEKFGCFHDK